MYTVESTTHGQNFRHVLGTLMKQVTQREGFIGITAEGHSIQDPCSTSEEISICPGIPEICLVIQACICDFGACVPSTLSPKTEHASFSFVVPPT